MTDNRSADRSGAVMLNLHRLQLLVELRNRGTIAAVADALGYSPSAVSQQLSRLEREAHAPLMAPVGRRVVLTQQGNLLADHAQHLLVEVERAETALAQWSGEAVGVLRLAMLWTLTATLGTELLLRLQARHPQLDVRLREVPAEGALAALRSHDVDLVVVEESSFGEADVDNGAVHLEPFLDDPLVLAVPPQWGPVDLAAVVQRPWATSAGGSTRLWVEKLCRRAGGTAQIRYETDHPLVLLQFVEDGLAAALLPQMLVASRAPHLPRIELPAEVSRTISSAVRTGSQFHPSVVACLTELRQLLDLPD
ncbi:LysR family transcriptional regulator [Propionibacteriaceae bacterium Y2011]